jgi:hypothetical protein
VAKGDETEQEEKKENLLAREFTALQVNPL